MSVKGNIILILGGARSGKSSYAQRLAEKLSSKVLFVATAQSLDEEMQKRIQIHRENRPSGWRTLEEPRNIVKALYDQIGDSEVVIIDCLTILVANLLGDNPDDEAENNVLNEIGALIDYIKTGASTFIIVSNELGLGLVPENKLARVYRDLLGMANQRMAQNAGQVYFLTAGIPLEIKNHTS